jgi:hypothetical protein
MTRNEFSNEPFLGDDRRPALPISEELAQLQGRTLLATILYAIVGCAAFATLAFLLIGQFIVWLKGLPAGVNPSWARLMADRPELLAISGSGIALGIGLATGGMLMWRRVFGADRMPSRKLVWTLGSLPLGLVFLGMVMTTPHGAVVTALTAPVMFGLAVALVPFEIGLLGCGMLRFAVRQLRERPTPIDVDSLSADVATYFRRLGDAAEKCRLEVVGDFSYGSKSRKFRRYYMAPNGAYFVDVTHASMGTAVLKAISVFGATDDGHYFEASDLANVPSISDHPASAHVLQMAGAPLEDLIEAHVQLVSNWTAEAGSLPLVFDAADVHELAAYGVAAHLRDATNEFLWLINPYTNRPLPPLPGRVWQPAEELELCGV